MNDDFEEDYYEEEEDSIVDSIKDAKDTYDDIKNKYNKYNKYKDKYDKYNESKQSPDHSREAKDFDKSLRDKNIARNQNPEMAQKAGSEVTKQAGKEATKAGTQAAAQTGTTAAASGTAAGTSAAAGTTAAATAGTATATAGTAAATGGAIAAQAAIPVAGWIALAIEAVIAAIVLINKMKKKHDEKMAENGIDSKGLRRLIKASPLLIIFAIFVLIMILLIQAETYDKVEFMKQAVECLESDAGCTDFMNTGIWITGTGKPVIRNMDLELALFVTQYMFAEHKYFGNNSSSFIDVVNDINTIAREGLDDQSLFDQIEAVFQELIDNSIIGDIRHAWNLFKWMKIEKKVYNNIDWYKSYNASSVAGISVVEAWAQVKVFDSEPTVIMGTTKTTEPWTWGFHGLEAYLETPVAISVEEAIELTKDYIPSWLEIYATYIATGDYELCNDMYEYYINEDKYKLEVTLYQLITVTQTEKVEGDKITEYYIKKDGESENQISQEEYDRYIEEGETGFFAWLGDALANLIEEVKNALEELLEWIEELLGFNVSVTHEYVGVVTKGNAFDYIVKQEYNILTEESNEYLENQENEDEIVRKTIDYKEGDEDRTATVKVKNIVQIDYDVTIWSNYLEYVSNSKEEYEEDNRYLQIFVDLVEEKGYNYTIDDVAMAAEVIESYKSEEYVSQRQNTPEVITLPDGGFAWPVRISTSNPESASIFRFYNSILPNTTRNNGIDIYTGNVRYTDPDTNFEVGEIVLATHDGIVSKVQQVTDENQMAYIEIKTEDGKFVTKYCNLSEIHVSEGDTVTKNQEIGRIGNTGAFESDTELYLHYEIYYNGQVTDPLTYYNITYNGTEVENYEELDVNTITNPREYRYESSKTYLGGNSAVLEIALQQDGETNATMRAKDTHGIFYGADWCAMFASWCLREAGVGPEIIAISVGCTEFIRLNAEGDTQATYYARSSNFIPQPGDLIFFNFKGRPDPYGSSHVGIVKETDDTYVYYVHGNTEGDSDGQASYWQTSRVKTDGKLKLTNADIRGYITY